MSITNIAEQNRIIKEYKESLRKIMRFYDDMLRAEGTVFYDSLVEAYEDYYETVHYHKKSAFEQLEAQCMRFR